MHGGGLGANCTAAKDRAVVKSRVPETAIVSCLNLRVIMIRISNSEAVCGSRLYFSTVQRRGRNPKATSEGSHARRYIGKAWARWFSGSVSVRVVKPINLMPQLDGMPKNRRGN